MLYMPEFCPAVGGKSKVSFSTLLLHFPSDTDLDPGKILCLLGQGRRVGQSVWEPIRMT